MKKHMAAILATAVAGSALASQRLEFSPVRLAGTYHLSVAGGSSGDTSTRDTVYYENMGPGYFIVGGASPPPRWHLGDFISFLPQHNTGALINQMNVPVSLPGNFSNQVGDCVVLLWNDSDPADLCDPNSGIMGSDLAGGFRFTTPALTGNNQFFNFDIDLSGLPGGGITTSGPGVRVEVAYFNSGTGTPHPVFTSVFAQNVTDPNDPNADCLDPNAVPHPTVGSSDDFFGLDVNSDAIISGGSANGCTDGLPNELYYFGGCPTWSNLFRGMSSVAAGCANPGCDDGGVDADFNGDCQVNLTDLATLLANFGGPGTNATGDTDADGNINLTDLANLLARFGNNCN